jgi:hypothetical protein
MLFLRCKRAPRIFQQAVQPCRELREISVSLSPEAWFPQTAPQPASSASASLW